MALDGERRDMTIADRIRGLMAMKHIKVRDMEKLFKISRRTWSIWMKEPGKISIGRLQAIAAKLGTTTAYLIGEEG